MKVSIRIQWACITLACSLPGITTANEVDRPNVLFIAVDDLNNYVSLLEDYPGIQTPNFERFAKQSVTFTRAYCAGPICNPSRTALLTGLPPYVTGVYGNVDHWIRSEPAREAQALPEAFKAAGYGTYWAGKIFHDLSAPSIDRLNAMWDDMGTNIAGDLWDGSTNLVPYGPSLPRGYGAIEPAALFPDVANAKLVREWLEQDHKNPFFMAVGIIRPHSPFTAPQRFFDMYPLDELKLPPGYKESDLDDVPPMGRELAGENGFNRLKELGRWEELLQAYLASVTFADDTFGAILEALEESQYASNTIIVLWGDHGFHVGEKNHHSKTTLWEQGTQNLLMVSAPGVSQDGYACEQPVSLLDIYPTLSELCGLAETPQELYGESLTPLLGGGSFERQRPVITTYPMGCHTLRYEEWRYTRYRDGGEELYDHANDRYEWNNLAEDPDQAERLAEMRQWLPQQDAEPVGPVEALRAWSEERSRTNMNAKTFGDKFGP